jgi:hypothetical protein
LSAESKAAILQALEAGGSVELPVGSNAVMAFAERGGIARVLATDLSSLRGTKWKSVTAGVIRFRNGKPDWSSFAPSRRPIRVQETGELL